MPDLKVGIDSKDAEAGAARVASSLDTVSAAAKTTAASVKSTEDVFSGYAAMMKASAAEVGVSWQASAVKVKAAQASIASANVVPKAAAAANAAAAQAAFSPWSKFVGLMKAANTSVARLTFVPPGAASNALKTSGAINSLTGAVKSLVAASVPLAVIFATVAAAKTADNYTNLQNRIRLVTNDSEELATVQSILLKQANENRVTLTTQAELYQRVARSAANLGKSQEEVLQVTDAVAKAVRISGVSTEAAAAALVQLGQGLASDTLRGDELRSVLEQTPRLAQAIADGMGVSIGKLRILGQTGSLSASKVIEAIQSQAEKLKKEADSLHTTFAQAFVVAGNNLTTVIGTINTATGASDAFAKALEGASNNLVDMLPNIIDFITEVKKFLAFMGAAIDQIIAQLDFGISKVLEKVAKARKESPEFNNIAKGTGMLAQDLSDATGGRLGLIPIIGQLHTTSQDLADAIKSTEDFNGVLQASENKLDDVNAAGKDLSKTLADIDKQGAAAKAALKTKSDLSRPPPGGHTDEGLDPLTAQLATKTEPAMRAFEIQFNKLKDAVAKGLPLENFQTGVGKILDILSKANPSISDFEKALQTAQESHADFTTVDAFTKLGLTADQVKEKIKLFKAAFGKDASTTQFFQELNDLKNLAKDAQPPLQDLIDLEKKVAIGLPEDLFQTQAESLIENLSNSKQSLTAFEDVLHEAVTDRVDFGAVDSLKELGLTADNVFIKIEQFKSVFGDDASIKQFFDAVKKGSSLAGATDSLEDYIKQVKELQQLLAAGVINVGQFQQANENFINGMAESKSSVTALQDVLETASTKGVDFGAIDSLKEVGITADNATSKIVMFKGAFGADASVKDFFDALKDGQKIAADTKSIEGYRTELEHIQKLFDAGIINEDQFNKASQDLKEQFDANAKLFADFAKSAAESIQKSFADFLYDPFKDGLKGMLSGFIDTMRRIAAEALANSILRGLFGAASSAAGSGSWIGMAAQIGLTALGGSASGSGGAGMTGEGMDAAAGLIPHANGGNMQRPMVVGERGRELAMPRQNGEIISNGRIAAAMADQKGGGSGASNVNVTVQGGDDGQALVSTINTAEGEKQIMIVLRRNAARLKRELGIPA